MDLEAEQSVARAVLEHIERTYGVRPEFLWMQAPDYAALRHPGSRKWFGALMLNLSRQRLGLAGDGGVDVLNLKCDPRLIATLVDGKRYLRGYHMNKEHWISVLLDGGVSMEELAPLIDMSHQLTAKRE